MILTSELVFLAEADELAYQRVYMIFDPCGRLPREQITTTKLRRVSCALDQGLIFVSLHEPYVDLVEDGKNVAAVSAERVGPAADRRVDEEVEGEVERRDREPVEDQIDQVYISSARVAR